MLNLLVVVFFKAYLNDPIVLTSLETKITRLKTSERNIQCFFLITGGESVYCVKTSQGIFSTSPMILQDIVGYFSNFPTTDTRRRSTFFNFPNDFTRHSRFCFSSFPTIDTRRRSTFFNFPNDFTRHSRFFFSNFPTTDTRRRSAFLKFPKAFYKTLSIFFFFSSFPTILQAIVDNFQVSLHC